MKIGFIGIGNMGSAMLKGAATALPLDQLFYTDVNEVALSKFKAESGIDYVTSNAELVQNANLIVLAIKPQYLNSVLEEIAEEVNESHIFLSIAPGVTIEHIKSYLGLTTRVVRSMPNTPALVLEGMSAFAFSKDAYLAEEVDDIKAFFNSFGRSVEVSENQLDMVVPVSGSSPAYGFMMIEAWQMQQCYVAFLELCLMNLQHKPCLVLQKWFWSQVNILENSKMQFVHQVGPQLKQSKFLRLKDFEVP